MAIRRSTSYITAGLVAVLLGVAPAPALSSETNAGLSAEQRCVASKLKAASQWITWKLVSWKI